MSATVNQQKQIRHSAQHRSFRQLTSRHLLPVFAQYKARLLLGFIALFSVDLLQLFIPRVLQKGIDSLAAGTSSPQLLFSYGGIIITIAIFVVLLRYVWRYAIIGFSRYLERTIRDRIFSHIIKMDTAFFERKTTGDIMAHSSNDLSAIQMACGMGLVAAVDATIMTCAAIIFMATLHAKLTVLALLPMPILAILTKLLTAKMHTQFNTVQEQFSLLTESARSALVNIRLIKAYTMEQFQTNIFGNHGKAYVKHNIRVARLQGLIFPLSSVMGNLGMLIILVYGGRQVIYGNLSIGAFVAFVSYLAMLIWPMMAIGWVANLMQRGYTSLNRIDALLEEESHFSYVTPAGITSTTPTFTCKDLTFSYPDSDIIILDKLSITFGPGSHGIAGRTGCGKSTLCKLLARLYPVDNDCLFFDDNEVNSLALTDIRSHISYVAQEPILFSESIAYNITMGDMNYSKEEIEKAARLAAIDKDINSFPDGYQTTVGERGVKLSGGQRQRLALARALLINRPVLIIDDGLSAVDVETEHTIFASLKKHLKGKTVIFVSNRLKLLSMTDRIIILDQGRIAALGTHTEVLAKNSFYQNMYTKQMRSDTARDLAS